MAVKSIELTAVRVDVLVRNAIGSELILGSATATIFVTKDKTFLVSNWHVFTGRRPNAPASSGLYSAVPTHLRLRFHCWHDAPIPAERSFDITDVHTLDVEINSLDGENPKWIEYPFRHLGVDLAAVEVALPANAAIEAVNALQPGPGIADRVGQGVLIVGFPEGLTGVTSALPIAKSGYVATNPKLSHRGHNRFLVDARTYRGMSGSPVFLNALPRPTFLLGIYSGRLYSKLDGMETELGYCWRIDSIEAMLNAYAIPGSALSKVSNFAGAPALDDCADPMLSEDARGAAIRERVADRRDSGKTD